MDHHRILEKAIALQQQGQGEQALRIFDALVAKTLDDGYTLYTAGTGFLCEGYNGIALTLLSQAVQNTKPSDNWVAAAWNNLASALKKEGHLDLAIKAFDSSLAIKQDASTIANMSGLYINQAKPEKVIELSKRALALDPYQPNAAHHYAMGLLESENYAEGFRWYNSRLRLPEFHDRKYPCPMWDGSPVDSLIIHGEQGVGDEIMFASLINEAKRRAKKVVIECATKLVKTFERSFDVPCYATDAELKAAHKCDAWIAMGSLPDVFKAHKPLEHTGYLKADLARVAYWKSQFPGPRIGISWRGGTKMTHWELRNFGLEHWHKLAQVTPLISLQYGDDWGHEIAKLGIASPKWNDFDDHMALVAACDLVISICNTTVHMAGSLNVPCWVPTPSKPAWRYGVTTDRMHFYPQVKLYRQVGDDWATVMERIRSDLGSYVNQRAIQGTQSQGASGENPLRHDGRTLRLVSGGAG